MGKRKEKKKETAGAKSAIKSQAEEALKTLMCSVQTWDKLPRGDQKLKFLEEQPRIYPFIVIREFKKSSKHGQKWFLGLMNCLQDFAPMAEPVKELLYSPDIYTEIKEELATLLSERGCPLDQDTMNAIKESHSLSSLFISALEKGEEGRIREQLPRLFSLPEERGKSLLKELLKELEGRALPLIRAALEEGENPVTEYLLELLGTTSSEELHKLLMEVARDSERKELQKAAKKAVYRLRSSGVDVKIASDQKSILRAPEYKFYGAIATTIDGEGNRMLWLARTKALGGLHLINCLLSDIKGILDCSVYDTNKKSYKEINSLISTQYSAAEIEPEYCSYLIEEAAKLNAKSDTALPEEYLQARHIIGDAGKTYARPPIYDHFDENDIYPNQMLLNGCGRLLELDEFKGWFISRDKMEPYNFKLQEAQESRIVLSEVSQKERMENIINDAADELLRGELKTIYRHRLEENAYILYRKNRQDDAKLALIAAIALDDENLPPHRHPFFIDLARRSLTLTEEETKGRLISPP